MRFFRPGLIARCLYPDALFRIKTNEKILYLTFDDGPNQASTNKLIEIIDIHQVKASFLLTDKLLRNFLN